MRQPAARLGLVLLGLLGACSVPTEAPKYTTQWNVPAKNTTISVNNFLPAGVQATTTAFTFTPSPATQTITRTLGQDCSTCSAANGLTIPKPAFTGGGSANASFPAGVTSATLVRDTLTVTINNGFNFDPIRPAAGTFGSLVISVSSGSTAIGKDSINGANLAIPAGGSLTRKIPLTGTVTGAGGIQIATTLNSPAGDPVTMDASRTITVSGTTGTVFVSAASVNLGANQQITSAPTDLDLSGVDKTITDHLDTGALLLTVVNPFSATGNMNVTFTGGTSTIVKSIALGTGTTTPSINLTNAELKSLFGRKITVTFAGTVSGANVTVTPGQTVTVAARLQIGIKTGSN